MKFPENLKYTSDHEWVAINGAKALVGITDYAQGELGDIIYVDVTVSEGDTVNQGDVLGTIEAVKTVSEIFSPISGTITGINSVINDKPSMVNQAAYGEDSWLIQIEPNNQDEISNLMDSKTYQEAIGM